MVNTWHVKMTRSKEAEVEVKGRDLGIVPG